MDRDSFRDVDVSNFVAFTSDYEDDDTSEYIEEKRSRIDRNANKRAKRGSRDPRSKGRGFTRCSKEDRQNRF